MKSIILLSLLICVSCSNIPKQESNTPSQYLAQDEVIKLFKTSAMTGKDAFVEIQGLDARKRARNLTPESVFFMKDKLEKLKISKSHKLKELAVKYTGKGYVDLRSNKFEVEQQLDSTCSAHALRNVINIKAATAVSTYHIWSKYKQYSCEAAIKANLNGNCITQSIAWPHDKNPTTGYLNANYCHVYLTGTSYLSDNIQSIINALDAGNPVYLGTSVTTSMLNCDKAINPLSSKTGGGHALAILGYKLDSSVQGGGYFIIMNSWGAGCADKGFQYLPFQHCLRSDLYCVNWEITEVKTTSTNIPDSPIAPIKKCTQWSKVWWKPWVIKCIKWE